MAESSSIGVVIAADEMSIGDQNFDDIREYVDIVCSFSCKFCSFTSTSAHGIRSHILEFHISGRDGNNASNNLNVPLSTGTSDVEDASKSQHGESVMSSLVYSSVDDCEQHFTEVVVTDPTSADSNTKHYILEGSLSSGDTITAPQMLWLTPPTTATESSKASQELCFMLNDCEVQLSVPGDLYTGTSVDQLASSVVLGSEMIMDHSKSANQNLLSDSSSQVSHSMADLLGSSQAAQKAETVTEIFICSLCNCSFNSANIGNHMSTMHGVDMESVYVSTNDIPPSLTCELVGGVSSAGTLEVPMPPNTASIGTQAQLTKKPGRKRKVVADVPVSISVSSSVHPDSDSIVQKNGQLNQTAAARAMKALGIERIGVVDGKCRMTMRRIQPPRALVEDYHIIRQRHSKRRVRSKVVALCTVKGCGVKFLMQEHAVYHARCHFGNCESSPESALHCPECNQQFTLWSELLVHLLQIHSINMYAHHCTSCDFHAELADELEEHVCAAHSTDATIQPQACRVSQRELTHSGTACTRRHRNGSSRLLSSHNFECSICKRTLANSKCLRKHIEIVHRKIKPFSCSVCGYVAARKAMLELHMRIHTGEKPFRCDICPYTASDHNTLRRHRMRHTGQKPYRCAFCPYTSIQAVSLKLHMRSKHPNDVGTDIMAPDRTSVFACSTCRYQTVNRRSWLSHVEGHRNGLASAATSEPQPCSSDEVPASDQPTADGFCPYATLQHQHFIVSGDTAARSECTNKLAEMQTAPGFAQDVDPVVGAASSSAESSSSVSQCLYVLKQDGNDVVLTVEMPASSLVMPADQTGLQHILTAISEQQHDKTTVLTTQVT